MKKVMLIIAGALFIGVAAQAQDPSTQLKKDSTVTTPTPPADPSTPTQPAPQDPAMQTPPAPTTPTPPADQTPSPSYRKDMSKVENAAIPEGLKSTLTSAQFKGWEEKGSVYTNADKSVYIVEMRDDVENRVKAYRFDATGKPIKE